MELSESLNNYIGFGTAPLGNMFQNISDKEAEETLEMVWDNKIKYFDTAPQYGSGLSETRLGNFLSKYHRDDYVLSTKVGRYISNKYEKKQGLFANGKNRKVITDYTREGTLRSIDQSLKRLKTDKLDIVFVHDISPDYYGDDWITNFDSARKGAFKVLERLKVEGIIKHWGIGVNTIEPLELLMRLEEYKPDFCLSATQYTLLQHQSALTHVMNQAYHNDIGLIIGAPYNSGALLGGGYYNYRKKSQHIVDKIEDIESIAQKYDVDLKSAALQFSISHPATKAVIPGSTKPTRIIEDIKCSQKIIPSKFWESLLEKNLVSREAPLPSEIFR